MMERQPLMLYDTVLLRTFAAVCETGSFTKAARVVNLTQSAVSLHVKRLEEQVGAQLLRREPQGVSATEQGEVLLSYARRILALHKEAERRLGGDTGGLIRIGAPEYFDLQTLSSLLGSFPRNIRHCDCKSNWVSAPISPPCLRQANSISQF
ncbi:MAG: LysR family transcriptional regulator [Methylovirgula sp.]